MFIDHSDQHIVLWKTNLKLKTSSYALGPTWGPLGIQTNQANVYKFLISWAIWLGFLGSLVSAIQCEANWREERPAGSRAVIMLRNLLLRSATGPSTFKKWNFDHWEMKVHHSAKQWTEWFLSPEFLSKFWLRLIDQGGWKFHSRLGFYSWQIAAQAEKWR